MKNHSGLQGVLGLCCIVLSFGAWAQGEEEEAAEEVASESDAGDSGSSANANDRRMYFSPMFSYTRADGDRATDDAMGGVVSLGKKMTSGLNLELTGFFETMGRENEALTDKSAELSGVGLAAMVFASTTFPNAYGLFAVHQGQGNRHPTTPDTIDFSYKSTVFDVGVGYLFPLNQWLGGFEAALRAELRYRMDSHHRRATGEGGEDEFYEGVANLGLLIPLGQLAKDDAPPVEAAPAPGDADGDGVLDDADQCPDTPAGATVNPAGCENDADGDGVVDRLDQCPDTPAGTTVDDKGCPPPAPEPGCRAPGPGEAINLEGCATGEAVVLKGVNFEVNSSRLTANAKVILNPVADSLAAAPHMRVEIGGHTDAQGSDAFNQKLSERRAQAVKDYLIARGIDASRLTSKGYGESQPVDSNETAEGRELNRRVEMKVLEGGAQ